MAAVDRRGRPERARRPKYLLSGLLKCGACGGGFSKISKEHYGCSTARNAGTCNNLLTIRRDRLEAAVLEGLKSQLMHPDCVKAFIEEYHREINRQADGRDQARARLETELARIERDLARLIEAIKAGVSPETIRDEITALETRKAELKNALEETPPAPVRLHPGLAEVYRAKVAELAEALNDETIRGEASALLRGLIEEIRLVPEAGELRIELYGELAALFALGQGQNDKHPRGGSSRVQVTLVAGAGFEPATFRL